MTRSRSLAAIAGLWLSLSAVHVWWLGRFRRGFPLDIDESGYLWFAVVLHGKLRDGGPFRLLQAFQHEGWVGPLLPAVTAIFQLPTGGRSILQAIAVQLLFLWVLLLATYGIGTHLHSRSAGVLAALVTACIPAVLDFVRTYHLVIPSTSLYTAAVFALLASRRLRRRGWSVAWGCILGLALLSRSMMIAFLPALVVAAGWMLIVDRADRRRIANFALGLAALAGTALLWYATSWRPILDYLVGFGYGAETPGRAVEPLTLGFWTHEIVGAVDISLYLPLGATLFAGFALAAAAVIASVRRSPSGAALELVSRAARSDTIVPLLVVVEGYLALSSSSNDGTGFVVPLLPSLVALAVVAVLRLPWRPVRGALVGALCVVACFDVVMKADAVDGLSRVRIVDVPVSGRVTLTNGRGFFHQHLVNEACYELGPPTKWLADSERGWLPLLREAAEHLARLARPGYEPVMGMAVHEPVVNTSSVRLASLRAGHEGGGFEYVDTGGRDTLSAYAAFLEERSPDIVLTATGQGCAFGPRVTQRLVERALALRGYGTLERLPMPDGRALHVWERGRNSQRSPT